MTNPEAKRAVDSIDQALASYDPLIKQYQELGQKGKFVEAQAMLKAKMAPVVSSVDESVATVVKIEHDFLTESSKSAESITASSRWTVVVVLGIALALGMVVAFVLRMVNANLRRAVSELSEGAGQVASAAGQISSPASRWRKALPNRRHRLRRHRLRARRSTLWRTRTPRTRNRQPGW